MTRYLEVVSVNHVGHPPPYRETSAAGDSGPDAVDGAGPDHPGKAVPRAAALTCGPAEAAARLAPCPVRDPEEGGNRDDDPGYGPIADL